MLLTLSPDSEDWLPVGYLMTESCLHLMLFGTNGNFRLWRKNQLFFPPFFFFFFVVVDKALPCAGTDLWKKQVVLRAREQTMPCSSADLSLFYTSGKILLALLPQFHISMKFWKKLTIFHKSPCKALPLPFQAEGAQVVRHKLQTKFSICDQFSIWEKQRVVRNN